MKLPVIGDRVYCKSANYEGYGEVTYIDNKNLYEHHFSPIQVTMEKPDNDGHLVKRFSMKEIKYK